ncbi:MAG: FtsX-like permease family protein [Lentisphaerae bacterium]|nr:FtsX-like permease family protein [Lentisphaerota bacterium]
MNFWNHAHWAGDSQRQSSRRIVLSVAVLLAAAAQPAAGLDDPKAPALAALIRSVESRAPGMPGNLLIEAAVADRFASAGHTHGAIRFQAPVFVPGAMSVRLPDGIEHRLFPMHPTLMRPGNFDETAFDAPLVYLGKGTRADLSRVTGVNLTGAIAVMEFDGGDAWQGLLRFGLRGFIFLAADTYRPIDAYGKVYHSEVSVPRFFAAEPAAAALRKACQGAVEPPTVEVRAEPSGWRTETLRNPWVLIPGSDDELSRDVVVVTAPIDANAIVPGLAADVAAGVNLELLDTLFANLTETPPKRSVLLVAVNAHTQYYLGERMLAWHLLKPAGDVAQIRDALSRTLREDRLLSESYAGLRFEPTDLTLEEANAAVDILWEMPPNDPSVAVSEAVPLDAAAARAALDRTLQGAREAQASFRARMTTDKAVVAGLAAEIAYLDAMRDWDNERILGLLTRALPVFHDEQILESWRAKLDTSTGVRIAIKVRLQDKVKRELNRVKVDIMELSRAAEKAGIDRAGFDASMAQRREEREHLKRVLTLFNKVDVGIGSSRTRYRHIATQPRQRELLATFRDELLVLMRRDATERARMLDLDTGNDTLRTAMDTRRPVLILSLGLEGPAGPAGLCSLSSVAAPDWLRGLGTLAADVAAAHPAPAGAASPFVDALSGTGGLLQNHFFPESSVSPAVVFHVAGRIPAVVLKRVFRQPVQAFIPQQGSAETPDDATAGAADWFSGFLGALINHPALTKPEVCPPYQGKWRPFWSCVVRTYEMDAFSSKPTPSLPVPEALVIAYPELASGAIVDGDVTGAAMTRTDASGQAILYGLSDAKLLPIAYQLAEDNRTVLSTIDAGQIQESKQMSSQLFQGLSRTLPMFSCREYVLYDRWDPSLVGSAPITVQAVWPISAASGANPRKYGTHGLASLSPAGSHVSYGPAGIYLERKREKFVQDALVLLTSHRRFAVNPTAADPNGEGYADGDALGPDFFARVAADMDAVSRYRLGLMKGVINELVMEFVDAGSGHLDDMTNAAAVFDHNRQVRATALALGNEVKAYEQIRGMNADMLKAVIVYMALMLPFCYFLQRLLFTFKRTEHEILAFLFLFLMTYVGFRFIHPAFSIALSAEAIFIAFLLGAIGCFVTWILHARFSEEMDLLFRGTTGLGGRGAGSGFVGQTAMLIGVNNMKRRRVRTTLTTATVVLVVFTMLAFSSVSHKVKPTLIHSSDTAPYTGLFYTWPGLLGMDEATVRAIEALYGDAAELLVRRVLFAPTTWRIASADEPGRFAHVDTALSLAVAEPRFVGAMPVLHGRPFSSDSAMEIAVPATLAEALNLHAGDIGTARLRLLGYDLTLTSILDDDRCRRMRDLDPDTVLLPRRESPTAAANAASLAGMEGGDAQDLSKVVYVPPELAKALGAKPFSVSVRLGGEDADLGPGELWQAADMFLRMATPRFFLGSVQGFQVGEQAKRTTDAGVYFVSGSYRTSIGGLSKLVIPLLIAGLILFNTMLGTVYERKGEIAIYNAIGLNPHHIFIFFLAEALVYGVIGAIGGYLVGQVLTLAAQSMDLVKGLNVNFSSLMVVWAILFTVGLVVASTLYPAFVATRTAVPSGVRRWSLPSHDGEKMSVTLPFIYQPGLVPGVLAYLDEVLSASSDASLGDLIVTPRSRSRSGGNGHPEFQIEYGMALAPFDLGVTQGTGFHAHFDSNVDSYVLDLQIRRESGQDASWATLNHPFLERIRGLLLRWRNLDPLRREQYVRQGESLFKG